LQEFNLSLNLF